MLQLPRVLAQGRGMRLQSPPAQQGGICPTFAKFRSPGLFLNRLQERGCSRARPPCRPAPEAFHRTALIRLRGSEWATSRQRSARRGGTSSRHPAPSRLHPPCSAPGAPGSPGALSGRSEAEPAPRQPGGETGSGTSPGGHCCSYRWEPTAPPACCTEWEGDTELHLASDY